VRAVVQRLGARAREQTEQRLKTVPREIQPERPASQLGVIMIDGFQVRHRGPDWGKRNAKKPRVEWHEQKVGVFYRQEHNARGQLTEKVSVSWQGEAMRLGERLHWEALRHGLGRAQQSLAVGDGALWVWGLIEQRWPQAWSTTIISGHRRQLKVTSGLGVVSSSAHGYSNTLGLGAIPFGGTESVAPSGAADGVEPKGIAGALCWSAWRPFAWGARTLPLVNSRIVA